MGFSLGDEGNESGSSFGGTGLMTEINITPFVDVILVLLIIFMVTAPLAISGVDINLPASKTTPVKLKDQPLVLSITDKGGMFLGKNEIEPSELVEKLRVARGNDKDMPLYIRADKHVPYGRVMDAMAAAQAAGIFKIAMLSDPDGKK